MKTLALPKLSTPGKLELARAALTNDLPALSKLVAAIPGSPDKVNTTAVSYTHLTLPTIYSV